MSSNAAPRLRAWLPPLPHEHGAWVALGVSALLGFILAGGATAAGLGLALGGAALFSSRESLSALTKPALARRNGETRLIVWGIVLILAAICFSLPAILEHPLLVAAGAAALLALAMHAASRRRNADRAAAMEAAAMLAIFALAPLIDYAQRGRITATETIAATTVAVTLAAGVTYAKMRIRQLALKRPRRIDLVRVAAPPLLAHLAACLAILLLTLLTRLSPLFVIAPAIALARCAFRAWHPKREKMAVVGRQETVLLALEFLVVLAAAGKPPV